MNLPTWGTQWKWKWTREQVIASIEAKTNTLLVLDPRTGKRADVGVVYPGGGRSPFLQTYADGDWNNNLLYSESVFPSLGPVREFVPEKSAWGLESVYFMCY